jgi:hypothetical protein
VKRRILLTVELLYVASSSMSVSGAGVARPLAERQPNLELALTVALSRSSSRTPSLQPSRRSLSRSVKIQLIPPQ